MPGRLLYIAAVFLITAAAAALFLGTPAECPVGNVDSQSATYSEGTDICLTETLTNSDSAISLTFRDRTGTVFGTYSVSASEVIRLPTIEDLGVSPIEGYYVRTWIDSREPHSEYPVSSVFTPVDGINEYVFEAKWEETYMLRYHTHAYSSMVLPDEDHFNLDGITLQSVTVNEGLTFKGWYRVDNGITYSPNQIFVMPSYDVDLHIVLEEKSSFTYSYSSPFLAGQAFTEHFDAFSSSSISDMELSRLHYKHNGWYDSREGITYNIGQQILAVSDLELTPVWQPNEYTITYEDTLSGISEDVKVTYGTEHQIRGISDTDGKVLIRWERTDDGSLTRFRIGDPYGPTEDITLRSVWAPQNVTVTMESEHHGDLVGNVPGGHVLTLPTGADPNFDTGGEFTLMRWMSGDTEYECGSQVELLDHTTFTAVWKRTKAMTPEIVADIPSSLSIGRGEEVLFDIRYEDVIGTETVAWYLNGVPSGEGTSFRLRPDLTTETGTFLVQARVTNVDTAAITTETVEDSSVCTVTVGDVWHLYIHGIPGPVAHYQRGSSTVTLDTGGVDTDLPITGLRHPDGGTLTDVWGGTVVIDVGEHDTVLCPILSDGMCQIMYVSHVTDVVTASVGDVITLSQTPEGKEGWDAGDGFLLPGGSRLAISGDITLIAV